MTTESAAIAAVVDRYPEEIRVRLLDAMKRIAAAYDEDQAQESAPPSNVVRFPVRRSSRQSSRVANRCPTILD